MSSQASASSAVLKLHSFAAMWANVSWEDTSLNKLFVLVAAGNL